VTTPAQLLADNVVLHRGQVAVVLGFGHYKDGGRGVVTRLIRDGKLRPVDPDQPPHRMTVSVAEVRRYIEGIAA
jgi:hypothetical protein